MTQYSLAVPVRVPNWTGSSIVEC